MALAVLYKYSAQSSIVFQLDNMLLLGQDSLSHLMGYHNIESHPSYHHFDLVPIQYRLISRASAILSRNLIELLSKHRGISVRDKMAQFQKNPLMVIIEQVVFKKV